jgi:hypothetical protein
MSFRGLSDNFMNELKGKIGNTGIKLPSNIDFGLNNKTLVFNMTKGLFENMQEDSAAFEGWAICLKANMPENIDRVEIRWQEPDENKQADLHYGRFLYRAWKFTQYFDWTTCSHNFSDYSVDTFVLNFPQGEASVPKNNTNPEYIAECKYVEKHKSEFSVLNHQLPVGVFDKIVSKSTAVMVGGKGQIDIWGIKDNTLCVFELKVNNKMVGIISELMFYVNIMYDVITGKIGYGDGADKCTARSFDKLYNAIKTIRNIHGFFLADELHPLITEDAIKLLNKNKFSSDISFEYKGVN